MNSIEPGEFQRLRAGFGYPDVAPMFGIDWLNAPNDYAPIEYVSDSVKSTIPDWDHPDLDAMWDRAQALSTARGILTRDAVSRRPLNPRGPTGVSGLGRMRSYGPNFSADGIVMHQDEVLLIERGDTGQLAFPGGYREFDQDTGEYEDPISAAHREISEETGLILEGLASIITSGLPRYVTRNTDNAWIEDSVVLINISDMPKDELTPVAADDAKKGSARWVPLGQVNISTMSPRHGEHVERLKERKIK